MNDGKTNKDTKGGARKGIFLAAGILVVSLTLFAVALFAVGGVDELMRILGVAQDPAVVQPRPEVPTVPDPDVEERPAEFPISAAQAAMYREQLQSQVQIGRLVDNKISSLAIGTAVTTDTRSRIPVTVTYRAEGSVSGTMELARHDGLWYFLSLTAAGGQDVGPRPGTVDSSVVHTIASQQATDENQRLIQEGLMQGGFKTARVDEVSKGAGSATVHVTLLGGTLDRQAARFILISKEDNGRKYWFITRFELK